MSKLSFEHSNRSVANMACMKEAFRNSLMKIRQKYGLDDPARGDDEMTDAEFDAFMDGLRDSSAEGVCAEGVCHRNVQIRL